MEKQGSFWRYFVVVLFGMAMVALGMRDVGPHLRLPSLARPALGGGSSRLQSDTSTGHGAVRGRAARGRGEALQPSTQLMGVLAGMEPEVPGLPGGHVSGPPAAGAAVRARMAGSTIDQEDKEKLNNLVNDVMAGKEPRKK